MAPPWISKLGTFMYMPNRMVMQHYAVWCGVILRNGSSFPVFLLVGKPRCIDVNWVLHERNENNIESPDELCNQKNNVLSAYGGALALRLLLTHREQGNTPNNAGRIQAFSLRLCPISIQRCAREPHLSRVSPSSLDETAAVSIGSCHYQSQPLNKWGESRGGAEPHFVCEWTYGAESQEGACSGAPWASFLLWGH